MRCQKHKTPSKAETPFGRANSDYSDNSDSEVRNYSRNSPLYFFFHQRNIGTMDPKLLVKSSKIIGSAPKMQFRKNQKNRPSSAVYLLVSQSVSRYWWHGWTPHPFAYICSQTVLLPRTLRSRSGSQLWGIEGAPRRQGGSIERGSESAQNSPTTEPQPHGS